MTDPRYKALLVGNGTFDRDPHNLAALKGPANDIRRMREALTHTEFGLFNPANVRHLLDGTNGEVLEAAEIFFNDAGPDDHLVFYYSGHGYPDTNNNLYLCARNTRTNLLTSSAVSDKALNQMAENSRAQKFIFILDCCHSGGFKGGTAGLHLAHGSGRCLITSCASDQLSRDAEEGSGASTFTHFLTQALTSGEVDADGDGIVLTSEVFKFVQPRVYNATKQTVQWTMDKTFGEAALALAKPPIRAATVPAKPQPTAPAMQPAGRRPMLEVSESRLEFRDVQPGETLPVERIDVFNTGAGNLDWTVESEESWIAVERREEHLLVTLDTAAPGKHRGNIYVRDRGRGGSRTIRVLLEVSEPAAPLLVVSPDKVDLGTFTRGEGRKASVRVSNAGPGPLQWHIEDVPDSLVVRRDENGFGLEAAPAYTGRIEVKLRVTSNAGECLLPVRATVTPPLPKAPRRANSPAVEPGVSAVLGWWTNDNGALHVKLDGAALVYTDHNVMGIKVGQGTVQRHGEIFRVEGTNTFTGAYTGQVGVRGNLLTGSLVTAAGQAVPLMFVRNQPWFAKFVS